MGGLTILLFASLASAEPTASDVEAWKHLQSVLTEAYPTAVAPTVRVEDGVVWVSGRIGSEAERMRIHELILAERPGLEIDDGLEVGKPTIVQDIVAEDAIDRRLESLDIEVDVEVEEGFAHASGEVDSVEQARVVQMAMAAPADVTGAVAAVKVDRVDVGADSLEARARAALFWSGVEYTDLVVDTTDDRVRVATFSRRSDRKIQRAFAERLPGVDVEVTVR